MAPILGILASQMSGHLTPTTGYVSIATTTVGAGGQSSITFSSIPSGYKHLQVRGIARTTASSNYNPINFIINGDSSTNYYRHLILADNSGSQPPQSYGYTAQSYLQAGWVAGSTAVTNSFGGFILDILDYKNTSKYKTTRSLSGADNNNTSPFYIAMASGTWPSTSAITSLTFTCDSGYSFAVNSTIALYGIQG
jgi:hypothetical protein